MGLWDFSETKDEYEANQAERVRWFRKIAPKGNWKGEIDAWIDPAEFDNCQNAAIWFTGGDLVIVPGSAKDGKVRVLGDGYYAVIGA